MLPSVGRQTSLDRDSSVHERGAPGLTRRKFHQAGLGAIMVVVGWLRPKAGDWAPGCRSRTALAARSERAALDAAGRPCGACARPWRPPGIASRAWRPGAAPQHRQWFRCQRDDRAWRPPGRRKGGARFARGACRSAGSGLSRRRAQAQTQAPSPAPTPQRWLLACSCRPRRASRTGPEPGSDGSCRSPATDDQNISIVITNTYSNGVSRKFDSVAGPDCI